MSLEKGGDNLGLVGFQTNERITVSSVASDGFFNESKARISYPWRVVASFNSSSRLLEVPTCIFLRLFGFFHHNA